MMRILSRTRFVPVMFKKDILRSRVQYLLKIFLLLSVYFITARLGLMLNAVSGFATLVWPPTGIALADLLIGGKDLWAGVFLGAVLVNWTVGDPFFVAFGIGSGSTLEALVGIILLENLVQFSRSL